MRERIFPILEKHRYFEKVDYVRAAKERYPYHGLSDAHFLTMSSILRLDAVARACRGDKNGAADDLRHIAILSDWAAAGPTLISHMVAVAERGIIAKASINVVLNARAPVPEDLAERLRRSLSDQLVAGGLGALLAERLDMRDFLENWSWRAAALPSDLEDDDIFQLVGRSVGLADIYVLEEASRYSPDDFWPNWTRMRAEFAGHYRGARALPFDSTRFIPLYGKLYQKEWEEKVWTQFALVSSSAFKFRAKTGRFPRTLDELLPKFASPDILIDPFSGKPFAYSAAAGGNGFALSSVGPDGNGVDSRNNELTVRF